MSELQQATFGGGCFWCLEAVFEQVRGVSRVVSGYAGGDVDAPSYQAVCTGTTGHAEVVQVDFDPAVVSFDDLLGIFFAIHDPTTPNRQGADIGTQYRSVVFTHDEGQAAATRAFIATLDAERVFPDPVVTQVLPLPRFWPAEDYHQHYFANNPSQPYCAAVVGPKVAKFRTKYMALLKA